MKFNSVLFVLFIHLCACGQNNPKPLRNIGTDSVVIPAKLFWHLSAVHEKVKLQEYELTVWENLKKIDTIKYKNDSSNILFIGQNGEKLKTIKQTFLAGSRKKISNFEDSIICYYNKAGLPEYTEWWDKIYDKEKKNIIERNKVTYSRYEYDAQNRLIRRLKIIPDGYRLLETTYDAQKNVIPPWSVFFTDHIVFILPA
ncbi:MAG: hypothetical protein QM727_09310 [Niabella sp.]